jgi:hypothetical protein
MIKVLPANDVIDNLFSWNILYVGYGTTVQRNHSTAAVDGL